jgi:hypothetical protein
VCDPVPVLVVAIDIASPRLLSSVPRSQIAVTSCPAIGYVEPLSSRLAPPLHWRPQIDAGTRYIVPVRAIQSAAHLVPPQPIADNKRWYPNNTVDLETYNFVY